MKDSVVAEVADSRQAMRTDQHPNSGPVVQSLVEAALLSRIATPLIANEQAVGTLHLGSCVPDVYGEPELARLGIVGNQIAGAIASEILLQAERDRSSKLESLYDVAAILVQPLSFAAKAQKIVDALVSVGDADNVALRRGGEEPNNLVLVASAGSESVEFQRSLNITDTHIATLEAYINGQSILTNDYRQYSGCRGRLTGSRCGVRVFHAHQVRKQNPGVTERRIDEPGSYQRP